MTSSPVRTWQRLTTTGCIVVASMSAHAWWDIRTSEQECRATWRANGVARLLLETKYTRALRRTYHSHLDDKKPVLMWHFPYGNAPDEGKLRVPYTFDDNDALGSRIHFPKCGPDCATEYGEFDVRARVFPDDDAESKGFVTTTVYPGFAYSEHVLVWEDFDWHDRFEKWGHAKEDAADPSTWVRVPEVRVVLNYTGTISDGLYDYEEDRYVDIPLWRTANMMNKMRRCGEALIETATVREADRPRSEAVRP